MSEGKCKKCGKELGIQWVTIQEDGEYIAVDKTTHEPLVLNKGDSLCSLCNANQDFYRRLRY